MKRVIGNEIWVFLKSSVSSVADIFGLLIDVTDDSIYVQCLNPTDPEVYIVPRDNIKYCTTKYLPTSERVITKTTVNNYTDNAVIQESQQQLPAQQQTRLDCLNVYINKELISSIPVPPTFNLNVWSDNIIRVIMGNPDVKLRLGEKTQKSIEYFPGEVYIEITDDDNKGQENLFINENEKDDNQNTFTMHNTDAATQFLNPSQMISRLNAAAKRGKKNGNQTKM
jgi:hypothetical protein